MRGTAHRNLGRTGYWRKNQGYWHKNHGSDRKPRKREILRKRRHKDNINIQNKTVASYFHILKNPKSYEILEVIKIFQHMYVHSDL